jgi:uncharacterized protein (TIGR03663 family)
VSAAVEAPRRPGRLARARASVAARPRAELIAWALLIALALAARLYQLGDRPFHHDESQDAYFSWLFRTTGDYAYNPLLHGPLRFYLTAAMYVLFGDGDFTARLAPALMGTLLVALPYGLRAQIGRAGAFAAGVLLAFGPTYLYFSRFAREDIYVAAITGAMIVVAFRFLARPRRHQPPLLTALVALSFATKETTFITLFVGGTFFLGALAVQARRAGGLRDAPIARAVRAPGWESWGWALAAFVAVFTILFTTFLTHPHGLYDGIVTGLEYWLSQHGQHRGGEAWFFYVVVLIGDEWPVLLLGAVGVLVTLRRPTLLRAFLIWGFVCSLVVYSWAGEKFAWLVLHPLLPLVLLAGVGVQALWEARRRWYGAAGIAVAVLALAYSGLASYWVNAVHRADPRELLVSTQSAEDVKLVAEDVVAADARAAQPLRVTVDAAEGATFPYAWYFRHLESVQYPDLSAATALPASDVAILTEGSRDRLKAQLGGFRERRFRFRVWWVRGSSWKEYHALSLSSAWAWLTRREPWSPTGGMPEYLETSTRVPPPG